MTSYSIFFIFLPTLLHYPGVPLNNNNILLRNKLLFSMAEGNYKRNNASMIIIKSVFPLKLGNQGKYTFNYKSKNTELKFQSTTLWTIIIIPHQEITNVSIFTYSYLRKFPGGNTEYN